MNIHGLETVDSLPCLYSEERNLLVLADLHLGLEGTMTREGNYVPKHQLDTILEDIEEARSLTGASRILVNGDLKNEFKTRYTETNEIKEFLEFLDEEFEETVIVKGNHDTFLDSTVEQYNLELKDYHKEGKLLFIHGDRGIENLEVGDYSTVIIGHEHPALVLEDDIGVREKVSCFLYGETDDGKNIAVLPAFSRFSRGTGVNETPVKELLSPILRENTDVGKLKAVAVSRKAGLYEFPEIRKI